MRAVLWPRLYAPSPAEARCPSRQARASKMDDHRAGSIAASLSNRSATVKSGEVVYACLRQPVLGATGFIGSAIVQELSHAGMARSDAGAKSLIDACADASSDLEATP